MSCPQGNPQQPGPWAAASDKGGLSGTEQPWSWALLGAEDTAQQTHARAPALLELRTRAARWQGRARGGAGGGLPHRPGAQGAGSVPEVIAGRQSPRPRQEAAGRDGGHLAGFSLCRPAPVPPPCRMRHLRATSPSLSSAANSGAGSGPSGRCLVLQGPTPPPGGALRPRRGAGGGVSDSGRSQTLQLETPGQAGLNKLPRCLPGCPAA